MFLLFLAFLGFFFLLPSYPLLLPPSFPFSFSFFFSSSCLLFSLSCLFFRFISLVFLLMFLLFLAFLGFFSNFFIISPILRSCWFSFLSTDVTLNGLGSAFIRCF